MRTRLFSALVLLCCSALSAHSQTPSASQSIDSILILKKEHLLELLAHGKVIRTYKVALGTGGLAPKEREGDARTPEGHYIIDCRNAASQYHKALHVSYPNAADRARAAKTRRLTRRRHHDPRPAQWARLYRLRASYVRLDSRLHRRHRRRDRPNLEAGPRRHASGDSPVAEPIAPRRGPWRTLIPTFTPSVIVPLPLK